MVVDEQQLIKRMHELLKRSDLNTTTNSSVRRKLEEEFEIDLSDRKVFIREQVSVFLQNLYECDIEEDDKPTVKFNSEEASVDVDAFAVEGPTHVKCPTKRRRSKKTINEGKNIGSGFNKLCALSPQLQEFIGVPKLARTEVVKQVWSYIRKKKLQDSTDKQRIICDEPLHSLFGLDSINMFQVNKALSGHIFPLEPEEGVAVKPTTKKRLKLEREDPDESDQKEKHQKGGKGFLAPLPVSDALKKFLGTGESELSRADAVKRIWNYIKQNKLQDPSDKKMVICDEKLKALFYVDTFHGFTVSKLLSSHLLKTGQ